MGNTLQPHTEPLHQQVAKLLVLIGAFLAGAALFGWAFRDVVLSPESSIAIDWKLHIYPSIENGRLEYLGQLGAPYPPWTMFPIVPLGLLSDSQSWGVLIYLYACLFVMSIPFTAARWRSLLALVLVWTNYYTIRTLLDANLELLALFGALVLVAGYRQRQPLLTAIGVLFVLAKPQVAILIVFVVGVYMLRTWPIRDWLLTLGLCLAYMVPSLVFYGRDWLLKGALPGREWAFEGSLPGVESHIGWVGTGVSVGYGMPVSAVALYALVIIAVTLWGAFRTPFYLTRSKAALLVCGSLLIAPYASNVSILTVFVLCVPALLMYNLPVAFLMILILNLPMFWRFGLFGLEGGDPPRWAWNVLVLIAWAVLCVWVYMQRDLPEEDLKAHVLARRQVNSDTLPAAATNA